MNSIFDDIINAQVVEALNHPARSIESRIIDGYRVITLSYPDNTRPPTRDDLDALWDSIGD